MQLRKQVDTQSIKRFKCHKGYAIYSMYDIKFGMLHATTAREFDFSAQMIWWYCAVVRLRGNTAL